MTKEQNIENSEEDLWGPIKLQDWANTPHLTERTAKEKDVKAGRAVFYIPDSGTNHSAMEMQIPCVVFEIDSETGEKTMAILIQAEKIQDKEYVGIRYLNGGNGVCPLSEVEIVKDPDEFKGK